MTEDTARREAQGKGRAAKAVKPPIRVSSKYAWSSKLHLILCRHTAKYEDPFNDRVKFPYLHSPVSPLPPPRARSVTPASASRSLSSLSGLMAPPHPRAVRTETDVGAAQAGGDSRSSVVARALAVMLRHDIPADTVVRVNKLGFIVIKLSLAEAKSSGPLCLFMDDFAARNRMCLTSSVSNAG